MFKSIFHALGAFAFGAFLLAAPLLLVFPMATPAAAQGTGQLQGQPQAQNAVPPRPAYQRGMLRIQRQDGTMKQLVVELADTESKREYGLMYVSKIPDEYGMLFVFQEVKPVSFWMKNTFIPLDLLFFDKNGRITHIHENAIPHDLTPIRSNGPIVAVLEVNAGGAKRHNLNIGDSLILEPGPPPQQ